MPVDPYDLDHIDDEDLNAGTDNSSDTYIDGEEEREQAKEQENTPEEKSKWKEKISNFFKGHEKMSEEEKKEKSDKKKEDKEKASAEKEKKEKEKKEKTDKKEKKEKTFKKEKKPAEKKNKVKGTKEKAENKSKLHPLKSIAKFFKDIKDGIKNFVQSVAYRASYSKEERTLLLKEEILDARRQQEKEEAEAKAKEDTNKDKEPDIEQKSFKDLVDEIKKADKDFVGKVSAVIKENNSIQDKIQKNEYTNEEDKQKDYLKLEKKIADIKTELGGLSQKDLSQLPRDFGKQYRELDRISKEVSEYTSKIDPQVKDRLVNEMNKTNRGEPELT